MRKIIFFILLFHLTNTQNINDRFKQHKIFTQIDFTAESEGYSNLNKYEIETAKEIAKIIRFDTDIEEIQKGEDLMNQRHKSYKWTIFRTYSHMIPYKKYFIKQINTWAEDDIMRLVIFGMDYEFEDDFENNEMFPSTPSTKPKPKI